MSLLLRLQYGMGMTKVLDCPKAMVGRVIGKGGETIKTLQKDTGAAVQIDQNVEPCKVTISGPPQKVQAAADLVQDIINGGTPLSHMSHFNKYGKLVLLTWSCSLVGLLLTSETVLLHFVSTHVLSMLQGPHVEAVVLHMEVSHSSFPHISTSNLPQGLIVATTTTLRLQLLPHMATTTRRVTRPLPILLLKHQPLRLHPLMGLIPDTANQTPTEGRHMLGDMGNPQMQQHQQLRLDNHQQLSSRQ